MRGKVSSIVVESVETWSPISWATFEFQQPASVFQQFWQNKTLTCIWKMTHLPCWFCWKFFWN